MKVLIQVLYGYTLKIIREDIETQYKERLSEIYEKLETLVEKKDVKKSQIVEHDNYVKELLRYIISDLKRFRQIQGDNTLGGMVICETSEQARKLFAYFDEIQAELNKDASMKSHLRAGLILHDSDDKDTRDKIIDDFKNNMTVDILIVFNMLLVFYNYILKCFVLIDLKTEKITHQDVGQMDMYIRMYDELKRSEGDNPTIGIVLCSDTDDDIARYSVMHGNEQLFASKYKLYLPTKEELKAEIETQKAMFYLQQQDNEDRNKNYTFNIE